MRIRKHHTVRRQSIQIRCLHDVPEEATHVAAAEVIDQHDNDVRLRVLGEAGKSGANG
jgi:hypothetical protein